MPNMMNRMPGVDAAAYTKLADTIVGFATAVEDLLNTEFEFPFVVGSEGFRDCTADEEHQGTTTKDALTRLSMNQLLAVGVQCDLHRGIAAVLPAAKVFFAPFPLARTVAVAAAKAWHILGGATREERLQRYLNEELDGLHRAPWDFTDAASQAEIDALTADHVAVGATAGLRAVRRDNARDWEAPYLVRSDQKGKEKPLSETHMVAAMFAASGFEADEASLPYTLLSATTHTRFHYAGVSESIPTGRSRFGVRKRALYSPAGTTAKVTALAAIATRTHLRALARYTGVPEQLLDARLGDALAEWCAIGGVPVPG